MGNKIRKLKEMRMDLSKWRQEFRLGFHNDTGLPIGESFKMKSTTSSNRDISLNSSVRKERQSYMKNRNKEEPPRVLSLK